MLAFPEKSASVPHLNGSLGLVNWLISVRSPLLYINPTTLSVSKETVAVNVPVTFALPSIPKYKSFVITTGITQ